MRMWKLFCFLALILLGSNLTLAAYLPLRTDVQGDKPQIEILQQGADQVELEVLLPGIELLEGVLGGRHWDRVEIPGGGYEQELGAPEVPHFTKMIAIPATAGVRAEFTALESSIYTNINLMPAQGLDPQDVQDSSLPIRYDLQAYSRDGFYPETTISAGEPAVMRGLRVVALQMNPVQYNPVSRELRVVHRFRVTVHFAGTDLRNVLARQIPISRSWAELARASVLNFDELDLDEEIMGSYLIVCENDANLVNNVLPTLVDWKMRKGHSVAIQTFTPGATNTTIKNLIQNAYNTWEIPPEFVLLVGDVDGTYPLPGWVVNSWPYGNDQIDHPYSQLAGDDILADVAIGRIPADDAAEAQTMINKVLFYEKMPYVEISDWYHQGVLVAGASASGISTIQVNRWIKTRMIWNEYTRIDTFWYQGCSGSVYSTVFNGINNGALYVNYRGCYEMENFYVSSIDNLTNGRKLPFVVTITCGTGGFAGSSESFMEHFAAVGTPGTPKGAVAAIGTATTNTHTRQNNTLDYGIFAGIFDENITTAGGALNRGKLELYNTYQAHDAGTVSDFSLWLALAGDPGLELFTHAIQYLDCTVPATTTLGENTLTLTVTEPGVGPVEGAIACVYKSGELHEVGLTDANGLVTLPLTLNNAGNVKVTITKQNYFPVVDSLDAVQAGVAVGYYDHGIDDDNLGESVGDNDGIINPGETVEIPLIFKNYGTTTTATSISVTAAEISPFANLGDSQESFPEMVPGATGNSLDDLNLTVAPDCPDGSTVSLNLSTTCAQGTWDGLLNLGVVSYNLVILSTYASGSDTVLSPGETANFVVAVRNQGGKDAAALTATLISLSPSVTVNDNSASFGTVYADSISANCSGNPFNLTATGGIPTGQQAELVVAFSANGATQTDTISIALGVKTTADPQGPDDYGYYCFDDTDLNYAQHPIYLWVEINPSSGGTGTQLALDDPYENSDASVNVTLPFTFRYYGQDVNQITVCSNGWISTWPNVSFADFRNYPIPSPIGPNGMIAPFWDDLITWSSGHIYTKNDAANHRFIIEWSHVKRLGNSTEQTFEIILKDPAFYPTATGDGEILFQYNTILEVYGYGDDNPYSTVGIERPDQQDGLEIVYWNTYEDPAAAHLQNGRAYLFTTNFTYAPPGADLYVTMTPSGTPIVIPPTGGSFNFNILVGNNSAAPAIADVWCMVTLPDGSTFGPTMGPALGLSLPAGWSTNRDRTQIIPGGAPPGNYTYHGYIGLYPNTVYGEDSFPFSKSGSEGSGNWSEGWYNTGGEFAAPAMGTSQIIPAQFALRPAYPNPFNPATTISFDLPQASLVRLSVYDLQGRRMAELANGYRQAGVHEVTFDGSHLASGLYFYRLEAGDFTANGKMMLLK